MDLRFIITGHGRSGTLWLARLLNQCDDDVNVHHEPLAQFDAARYADVYAGALDADKFLRQRRLRMERIWQRHPEQGYAEVNSYLRYCVPALREAFPFVPILGLVRDGRYVVRSLLERGCYRREGYPPIAPPRKMTPFAACCWYWADTYRRLTEQGVTIFPLEALNTSFAAVMALADQAGARVSHDVWLKHAGRRANVSVADEEPPVWTFEEVETFARVAGDVQEWFGYEMEGGRE